MQLGVRKWEKLQVEWMIIFGHV